MRKICFMITITLFVGLLTAEVHSGTDDPFTIYQQDQTFENFQNAVNYYNENLKESDDYKSVLILSYLHAMELNNKLDILEINLDSLDTRTKFSYANLLLETGKTEESITIYNKLNTDFPNWSCPWRHKGEALLKQQDYQAAEVATVKAIEVREDHFDAYIQLAKIKKELGKYEEALRILEKGMEYVEATHEDEVTTEEVEVLKNELIKRINNK